MLDRHFLEEIYMGDFNVRNLGYEAKPFLVGVAGLYALSLHHLGTFPKLGGLVLLICGAAILYMRAKYRGLIR
jgi:hypothetical protein